MARPRILMRVPATAWQGLGWFAFSVFGVAMSFTIADPFGFEYGLKPTFWPRLTLVGLALSACGLICSAFAAPLRPTQSPKGGPAPALPEAPFTIAVAFGLPVAYLAFMQIMGFLVVTPVFLAGYMRALGLRDWRMIIGSTIGVYAFVVLVFVKLFYVPLPGGVGVMHTFNAVLVDWIR